LNWDHTEGKFVLLAKDKFSAGADTGREFVDVTPRVKLSPAEYLALAQSGARTFERRIWAFQMGSNNQFVIQLADNDRADPANGNPAIKEISDIKVFRQIQTNVVPGSDDAPTEGLVCIGKCPRPNNAQIGAKLTLQAVYSFPSTDPRTTQLYNFDNSTGDLTVDGLPVRFEVDSINRDGIDTQREDLWLGTFVTPDQLSSLNCARGDPAQQHLCQFDTAGYERRNEPGQTFGDLELEYYYIWSTGPYRWQRFSGVKDSQGQVVPINEPLMLTYAAPNDAEFGRYANKRVSVRYPGNGQLWLPGRCENITNPSAATSATCGGANEAFIHDFIIPTDTGPRGRVVDAAGKEYLVKWTRQGVFYPEHTNPNACRTTGIQARFEEARSLPLPSSRDWNNPRASLGAAPVAGSTPSNPKYVNGVAAAGN
jgi:hypothetical protein